MSELSRYTPSILSHDRLEELFVGEHRTRVLVDLVASAERAATSAERNHRLLVGQRGAGKTHLIALAYYRIKSLIDEGLGAHLSWIREDPWTIYSYGEFLKQIAEAVEIPDDRDQTRLSGGDGLALEDWLDNVAGDGGPIVVLVENLDQILETLDDPGQQQLRHYLQSSGSLLLLATTTALSRPLAEQHTPFYGFFTTTSLRPLMVDEASELLSIIARSAGDNATAEFLQTDVGTARLEAIAHLAGGHPRMWVTLGGALNMSQLSELVDSLMARFDDLTPYYQEQLGRLSPLQRRIVAALAAEDRPLNVKAIAELIEVDERSVGKQANELANSNWISPCESPLVKLLDQRRTYYELSEPLARVVFQLKESRGEPIRTVIDFLKVWFEPHQLQDGRAALTFAAADYAGAATDEMRSNPDVAVSRQLRGLTFYEGVPRLELLTTIDLALELLSHGDPEPLLALNSSVRRAVEHLLQDSTDQADIARARLAVHSFARRTFGDVPHEDMNEWELRARSLATTAAGRLNLFGWRASQWDFDNAVTDSLDLQTELGPDHPDTLTTRHNLANSYRSAGRIEEAIALEQAVLADRERILGPDHPNTLTTRHNLASSYWSAGRVEEAIALQQAVLADSERILGPDHPNTLTTRHNLASSYRSAGRVEEAIALQQAVLADSERILGPEHQRTRASRRVLDSMLEDAVD